MGGANDTATDAVRLQDRIAVPGWSHLAMQTEAVAVMIHVLGGAAEHRNARDPGVMPWSGKLCGPVGGVRGPS
jgi:hypothetical protein